MSISLVAQTVWWSESLALALTDNALDRTCCLQKPSAGTACAPITSSACPHPPATAKGVYYSLMLALRKCLVLLDLPYLPYLQLTCNAQRPGQQAANQAQLRLTQTDR